MKHLGKLAKVLRKTVLGENRQECKLFVAQLLGGLDPPRGSQGPRLSEALHQSGEALDHVLRLLCEQWPAEVMKLFSRDSELLRDFFRCATVSGAKRGIRL